LPQRDVTLLVVLGDRQRRLGDGGVVPVTGLVRGGRHRAGGVAQGTGRRGGADRRLHGDRRRRTGSERGNRALDMLTVDRDLAGGPGRVRRGDPGQTGRQIVADDDVGG